jgi:lantibiotic modifying enzyme
MSKCTPRYILRHTIFYGYLIRRIQQPDLNYSKPESVSFLASMLSSDNPEFDRMMPYEIDCLIKGDIPYFIHRPGERLLIDHRGRTYGDFFSESALDAVPKTLASFKCTSPERFLEEIERSLESS